MARPTKYSDVTRLRGAVYGKKMSQQQQPNAEGLIPTPTQDEQPVYQKPAKAPKGTRTVERVIGPGYETFPMNNQFVVAARGDFGAWGVWGFVAWLFGPTLLVSLFRIPVIPPALMRYGYIEYVFFGPLYLWNLLLPKITDRREFYQFALGLNAVALGLEIWLFVVLCYNWYACTVGIYPNECKKNYPIDLPMTAATLALLIVGIATVGKLVFVLTRTANTTPPSFVRVTNY